MIPPVCRSLSGIRKGKLELWIDIRLLTFVWGVRPEKPTSFVIKARLAHWRDLLRTYRFADIERIAIVPILFCFVVSGVVVAAVGIDGVLAQIGHSLSREFYYVQTLSAIGGLLFGISLLWRFLPAMLEGAMQRASERAEDAAKARTLSIDDQLIRRKRLRRNYLLIRRGLFLGAVVMPIAVFGLVCQRSFWMLCLRPGALLS